MNDASGERVAALTGRWLGSVVLAIFAGLGLVAAVKAAETLPGPEIASAWVVELAPAAGNWQQLLATGVEVVGALPPASYLVRGDDGALAAVATLPELRSLVPYGAAHKLDAALASLAQEEGEVTVDIVGFAGSSAADIAAALADGGLLLASRESGGRPVLRARTDTGGISRLAGLEAVAWIEAVHEGNLFNDEIRVVMQTERAHYAANQSFYNPIYHLGIYGAGEIIAMGDSGLRADHEQFLAPGKLLANYVASPGCGTLGDPESHGTPVANTLLGDSLGPLTADYRTANGLDGVAPGAQLVMQDIVDETGFSPSNQTTLFCDGYSVPDVLLDPATDQGAAIHNHSWGHMYFDPVTDQGWGSYGLASWELDDWLAKAGNREQVVVFAAGNEGGAWVQQGGLWYLQAVPRTISDEGHAKNIITVGASRNGNSRHLMYGFSSRGPTNDCGLATQQCPGGGRIKPDVVAPGSTTIHSASSEFTDGYCPDPVRCLSWDPDTSQYGYYGTSHAAPAISGAAALVREYFRRGFYPNHATDPPLAGPPSSALVKAMLVNASVLLKDSTAYAATQLVGASAHAYPNYDQGFGRPALDNVLEPAGFRRLMVFEDDTTRVATNGVWWRQPTIPDTWQAACSLLRVTLAWTDPPPALGANPVLVNDLDLEVSFGGQTYLGNEGLNGHVADRLNNVEDVFVPLGSQHGAQLRPLIRVRGTNVMVGHDQPFAVVFTYGPCLDTTPCPGPLAGGCYAGPGDVVPNHGYTVGNPCEDQHYSTQECVNCSDGPYPTCSPPPVQVPGQIKPVGGGHL